MFASQEVETNQIDNLATFPNLLDLFHVSSWERAHRKRLESGKKKQLNGDWMNLLSIFEAD